MIDQSQQLLRVIYVRLRERAYEAIKGKCLEATLLMLVSQETSSNNI